VFSAVKCELYLMTELMIVSHKPCLLLLKLSKHHSDYIVNIAISYFRQMRPYLSTMKWKD
jgi:hypothetical protein